MTDETAPNATSNGSNWLKLSEPEIDRIRAAFDALPPVADERDSLQAERRAAPHSIGKILYDAITDEALAKILAIGEARGQPLTLVHFTDPQSAVTFQLLLRNAARARPDYSQTPQARIAIRHAQTVAPGLVEFRIVERGTSEEKPEIITRATFTLPSPGSPRTSGLTCNHISNLSRFNKVGAANYFTLGSPVDDLTSFLFPEFMNLTPAIIWSEIGHWYPQQLIK